MKTALLGYGVVGSGVHALAEARPEHGITISRVLVRRDIAPIRAIATRDFQEIVSDPSIETVVEVMGGEEPALTYVKAALAAKKHVVTANKLMLSLHYEELLALARANGVRLAFSAAVGGGIPWLANLLRVSRVDRVASLGGIMNGTTNFILTAMQQGGADFAETLAAAQKLGYAEADPTADIDGLDVRAKLALSCDAAFAQMADASAIPTLGIRYITAADVAQFHALGLTCRLCGAHTFCCGRTGSGCQRHGQYHLLLLRGAGIAKLLWAWRRASANCLRRDAGSHRCFLRCDALFPCPL